MPCRLLMCRVRLASGQSFDVECWSDNHILPLQVGGPGLAVVDDGRSGPKFGAEGLTIPLQGGESPRAVRCRLGTFYQRLPDGSRSLFPEGATAELADLKVAPAS